MTPEWTNDYLLFVLRLNHAIVQQTQSDYLLDYYGPAHLQAQVAQEAPARPLTLRNTVIRLREELAAQAIEAHRSRYLAKLLDAYELMSRRLGGERIPMREQARACLDIAVEMLPESLFENAHALYDEALVGKGTPAERLAQWKAHYTLPPNKTSYLPALIQKALREARRRTNSLIPLPPHDEVEIAPIRGQPVRAMAHYLGNRRARILINPDYPFNLADLLYVVCHEAYPGHLTELMMKERHLGEEQGYGEQLVHFLITPPFVLSEGIALWAHEVIFPGEAAEAWLTEQIYPQVGIHPDGSDLKKIQEANDQLFGVQGNAALMLDEGYSTEEVVRYLMRYALMDETGAHRTLDSLRRPYAEVYPFTYFYGRRLLHPIFTTYPPALALARLLARPLLPSDLAIT